MSIKSFAAAFMLSALMVPPAFATNDVVEFYQYYSAKELVNHCDTVLSIKDGKLDRDKVQSAGKCLGYITGFLDLRDALIGYGELDHKRICAHEHGASIAEVARMVLRKYEPAVHDQMGTAGFLNVVLTAAYPCKKK